MNPHGINCTHDPLTCSDCATVCSVRLHWHREIAEASNDLLHAFHAVAPSMIEQFAPALRLQRALSELNRCRKEMENRT